jgi:glucose-1-phosphate cytidylyltransferase
MGAAANPEEMPVVVLAGGAGARLREETERIPKPLVEVGHQPILWHIMKLYSHYGFRRFVLCLGYKGWAIKQYGLSYRDPLADFTGDRAAGRGPVFRNDLGDEDWEITCAETGQVAGTGTRLYRVRRYIDTDTFMFTYGDGIGAIDLLALLEHHRRQGRVGTVTGVHPTSRYGEMRVEGAKVVEFNEKPTMPEGFVSGGFFVVNRGIFDYLSDDEDLFFEAEPLQKLARDGELSVFPHEGFWQGLDTYRDLRYLTRLWRSGDAPWKVWAT